MPYALTVKTPPGAEPLTTLEAKSHLRIDVSDDDTLIASYVKAAREWYEAAANRALISQVLQLRLDRFPGQWPYGFPGQYDFIPRRTTIPWQERYSILLPRAPLVSVASIQYVDIDGNTQTLSSSLYQVDAYGTPGRVLPVYGQTWPIARAQANAVTIEYTAGYGASATDVPEAIRQLLRLLVANSYENREPIVMGTIVNLLPLAVQTLFWQTRALVAA